MIDQSMIQSHGPTIESCQRCAHGFPCNCRVDPPAPMPRAVGWLLRLAAVAFAAGMALIIVK